MMPVLLSHHVPDLIHGGVVLFIVIAATVYALVASDHSSNIWIVYGSGIAFAAGRAGAGLAIRQRTGDPAP